MIESQPTEIEIFLPEREKKVAAAVEKSTGFICPVGYVEARDGR